MLETVLVTQIELLALFVSAVRLVTLAQFTSCPTLVAWTVIITTVLAPDVMLPRLQSTEPALKAQPGLED